MSDEEQIQALVEEVNPWKQIQQSLREKNRFFLPPELDGYLDKVITYVRESHEEIVPEGTKLFRARTNPGQGLKEEAFSGEDMGAPGPDKASAGRINPEGISYFYTAEEERTAVSEIRPWVGGRVTVATFKTTKDLSLANGVSPTPVQETEKLQWLWQNWIAYSCFSRPVPPAASTDYVFGQYVAERLKNVGFDGIRYESAMNMSGINVALFDQKNTAFISSKLIEITELRCKYENL